MSEPCIGIIPTRHVYFAISKRYIAVPNRPLAVGAGKGFAGDKTFR
jgi:hypothetical protein